jgi:hypothetical protein
MNINMENRMENILRHGKAVFGTVDFHRAMGIPVADSVKDY